MERDRMTEKPPIRVLLADDHILVRGGIRALLEKIPGVEVAGEAGDGREVLEKLKTQPVEVVLMDIAMPGLNGLEATARISQEFPAVRVIILSMYQNEEYYRQALKAGAAGYLLKKAALTELQAALERVMAGQVYLSQEISSHMDNNVPLQQMALSKSPLEQLTTRQREILQLIAEGQNTKTIALLLKVSPKTVEYHRAQLMARLGIFDIPGLVRFALKFGLVAQEN
jgi:DNA-binding NarL/FixJ family response regulator